MRRIFNYNLSQTSKDITTATSIRWFGWGFVELLIPLFIFSIAGNYGETGLLTAVFSAIFLLSLPIVGELADRTSLRVLFLVALVLYIVIGGSYFLAAVFGGILFLFIAKAINGVSWAIDSVTRETAFLRYEKDTGRAFAFFESIASFWWLIAVLISIFIAPVVDIKWLFLGIVLADIVALPFVMRLPHMREKVSTTFPSIVTIFKNTFNFSVFHHFNKVDRFPVIFVAILANLVFVLPTTFLAIFSYVSSNDIRTAIVIGGLSAIPAMMSVFIGTSSDTRPRRSMVVGLSLLVGTLILFSFADSFVLQMAVALLAGVAIQIMYLATMVLVKRSVASEHLGATSSALNLVSALSEMIGVVIIGFLIDIMNPKALGIILAGVLAVGVLVLVGWWLRFRNR